MSLRLDDQDTTPSGVEVKTNGHDPGVYLKVPLRPGALGQTTVYVTMPDFCAAVEYVLTNADLEPNDPREELVRRIANHVLVAGRNGGRRIEL